MTNESEGTVLTPKQRKYIKEGSKFIRDNDYTKVYADVLESRIRDRFYGAISDLDLLLRHKQRWMSKTTEPLDRQNPKLHDAIEGIRTDQMRRFVRDVVSGDNNDIEAYGLMLQSDSISPPELDTAASHSAQVTEKAETLQDKFNFPENFDSNGTSLGPVGSIIEILLPSANDSVDREALESYQNRAVRFTLLNGSGNPIEKFPLAVKNGQINLVISDHTESEFDWYGEAVTRQETALEILNPSNSTDPDIARYQKGEMQIFPKENESREVTWLFCSALLDALSAPESTANK